MRSHHSGKEKKKDKKKHKHKHKKEKKEKKDKKEKKEKKDKKHKKHKKKKDDDGTFKLSQVKESSAQTIQKKKKKKVVVFYFYSSPFHTQLMQQRSVVTGHVIQQKVEKTQQDKEVYYLFVCVFFETPISPPFIALILFALFPFFFLQREAQREKLLKFYNDSF